MNILSFLSAMTSQFMRSCALHLIKTCHQRGIFAMGGKFNFFKLNASCFPGMAAQIPIKHDQAANDKAIALVRADKEREASDGNDGSWVAHPGLVPLAMDIYNSVLKGPNQINKQLPGFSTDSRTLTEVPEGTRTEAGFRRNISVTLGYLDSYLRGVGCVPLYNMMEG
jgi:malate synthase